MHESVKFVHVQCLYKREMFLHKVLYASISAQKDGGGGGGGRGYIRLYKP